MLPVRSQGRGLEGGDSYEALQRPHASTQRHATTVLKPIIIRVTVVCAARQAYQPVFPLAGPDTQKGILAIAVFMPTSCRANADRTAQDLPSPHLSAPGRPH